MPKERKLKHQIQQQQKKACHILPTEFCVTVALVIFVNTLILLKAKIFRICINFVLKRQYRILPNTYWVQLITRGN